jgi:hypothetical protein
VNRFELYRLGYHGRLFAVSVVAGVGAWVLAIGSGTLGQGAYGQLAIPLLLATTGVLGTTAWLGWIDFVSALTLDVSAKGLVFGWPTKRTIAWSDITRVMRATGTMRLLVETKGGPLRVQMLVLKKPIAALKTLVSESKRSGAKVEEYLAKLADYLEEDEEEES